MSDSTHHASDIWLQPACHSRGCVKQQSLYRSHKASVDKSEQTLKPWAWLSPAFRQAACRFEGTEPNCPALQGFESTGELKAFKPHKFLCLKQSDLDLYHFLVAVFDKLSHTARESTFSSNLACTDRVD